MKLTPDEARRLFELSKLTGISFVELARMAIEIGLKVLEAEKNSKNLIPNMSFLEICSKLKEGVEDAQKSTKK